MDATDYVKEQFIDWVVKGEDMPLSHGSVYVGLHTGDPTSTGEENEVTADSYERVEVLVEDWNISGGSFENINDIDFPEATENWGVIEYFSIWDGPSDTDNSLGYSALTPEEISDGERATFRDGDLTGEML